MFTSTALLEDFAELVFIAHLEQCLSLCKRQISISYYCYCSFADCSLIKYIIYQVAVIGMTGAEGRASVYTGTERTWSDRQSWLCWSRRSVQYRLGVCQRRSAARFSYYELVLNDVSSCQKHGLVVYSIGVIRILFFPMPTGGLRKEHLLKCNPPRLELYGTIAPLESSVCTWEQAQAVGLSCLLYTSCTLLGVLLFLKWE